MTENDDRLERHPTEPPPPSRLWLWLMAVAFVVIIVLLAMFVFPAADEPTELIPPPDEQPNQQEDAPQSSAGEPGERPTLPTGRGSPIETH